jgi:hypothetical protein
MNDDEGQAELEERRFQEEGEMDVDTCDMCYAWGVGTWYGEVFVCMNCRKDGW